MAQAFSTLPDSDGVIIGFLDDVERSVVIELLYQTSVLLSQGVQAPAEPSSTGDSSGGDSPSEQLLASLGLGDTDVQRPTDPALLRLLPDGVHADETASAEFRRFTQPSLRARKLANLETTMRAFEARLEDDGVDDERTAALADAHYQGDSLDEDDLTREVILDRGQARAAMMALTDVRLVLAQRLDITTDEDAEALEGSHEPLAAYYDFLTWLCESITLAVLGKA